MSETYLFDPQFPDIVFDINAPEEYIPTDKIGTSNIPGITGKGDLSKKPHHAGIDPFLTKEIATGMRYGANKHGKNNFRTMTQEAAQEIRDSIGRHWNDGFLCGQEIDPESGISHLALLSCNINMLYRITRLYGYEQVMKVINGGDK